MEVYKVIEKLESYSTAVLVSVLDVYFSPTQVNHIIITESLLLLQNQTVEFILQWFSVSVITCIKVLQVLFNA